MKDVYIQEITLEYTAVLGKSQIKSHEIKSNPNHLDRITNQIKSRCQPNDNSSRLYSLCAKCHQCTSDLTLNVSAKIRDGTITEINSLTQLQQKHQQSNHYSFAQITKSCDLFKSTNQIR